MWFDIGTDSLGIIACVCIQAHGPRSLCISECLGMSNFLAHFLKLQEIAALAMYPRRRERLLEYFVEVFVFVEE